MQQQLIILLIYLCLFAAVFLLIFLFLQREKEEHAMRSLGLETSSRVVRSPIVRMLRPLFRFFVPLARVLQTGRLRETRKKQFRLADMTDEMTSEEFLAYQLFLGCLVIGLLLLFSPKSLLSFPALLSIIAFFYPVFWLKERIATKTKKIVMELPYAVDMLALSTEAGLGFIAGIQRLVTSREETPLMLEFEKFLNELKMGANREDALKNMMTRCDATELNQFIIVLVQATKLGVAISSVLRVQSEKMRMERMQRAERMGAYATQKLIFPLIFCIMPATMIVILGPLVISFLFKVPVK